jgi:hypothetical protein
VGNAAAQFMTAEQRVRSTRGAAEGRAGVGAPKPPPAKGVRGRHNPGKFVKFYMKNPAFWHISDGLTV